MFRVGLRVCIPDMLPPAAIRSTFARKVLCIPDQCSLEFRARAKEGGADTEWEKA